MPSTTAASSASRTLNSKVPSSSSPSPISYGLSQAAFTALINTEYPSLHSIELVHLDHAASPPPPISAISSFTSALATAVYSNPHSHAPTQREVDTMRTRVMQVLFGLGERAQEGWDLVWTSGTSASLKLVGEHFPWTSGAKYRYLKESHTSLVGVRGCALAGGAGIESLDLDELLSPIDASGPSLHAYPAQCNVTGSRLGLHPSRMLSRRRRENEAVLVDAAAYLSTSPLDLSDVPYEEAPDFVVGSFYKIYGHPTGLGFLLVKRSSAHFLSSKSTTYFGGGAIDALSVSPPYWVYPRGSKDGGAGVVHERFENGTIPYLSIVALGCAMDAHQRLFTPRTTPNLPAPNDPTASLRAVSCHTQYLVNLTRTKIESLSHWDGTPLVKIHRGEGSGRWEEDGPTISFTLYTPISSTQGSRPVGHTHLLNLATLANIHFRTGGMCNTGVLARVSELSDRELKNLWEEGRVCGDGQEFGGNTGDKLLGLARISFGACSSVDDVHKFVEFLTRYFLISEEVVEMSNAHPQTDAKRKGGGVYLQSLVRYPIKSCAGQSLASSALTPTGLLHDREFMLINSATGKTMSQKQFPRMVLIKPFIDDDDKDEVMRIRAEGMPDLTVPLHEEEAQATTCNDSVRSYWASVEADGWFSKFLGVPCQLRRFAPPSNSSSASCSTHLPSSDNAAPAPILFSNESPFTLISTSSVDTVNDWIASDNKDPSESRPIHPSCFRANFTVSSDVAGGLLPFHEDTVSHLRIGTQTFQVLARCRRCLMICVDQDTGVRMREPFCCLARHRRNGRRRVEFGVHLMWRGELSEGVGATRERRIRVGDRVEWTVG